MDEYPIVGKLCSWPTVVGFLAGMAVVIFVVYPPHVGWGDGMKWGDVATWAGAFMSGGAAIAAWYAARSALKIAREDRAERVREAVQFKRSMLEAMGVALLFDVRALLVFVDGQLQLLAGKVVEGRTLRNGQDLRAWCLDVASMPSPSFDKFADTIHQIGPNARAMIHIYGEIIRIRAYARGFDESHMSVKNYGDFNSKVGESLKTLMANLWQGHDLLAEFLPPGTPDIPVARRT